MVSRSRAGLARRPGRAAKMALCGAIAPGGDPCRAGQTVKPFGPNGLRAPTPGTLAKKESLSISLASPRPAREKRAGNDPLPVGLQGGAVRWSILLRLPGRPRRKRRWPATIARERHGAYIIGQEPTLRGAARWNRTTMANVCNSACSSAHRCLSRCALGCLSLPLASYSRLRGQHCRVCGNHRGSVLARGMVVRTVRSETNCQEVRFHLGGAA